MPMRTMLNGLSRSARALARSRTCPTISPAVRLRTRPILPVKQNAHAMAHPTCVEIQKVIAGVSGMNTDSIWRPSLRRRRNFSVPSVDRSRATNHRRGECELRGEGRAQPSRQIGHRVEVGHPTAVDPTEDLSCAELFVSPVGESRLERGALQPADVQRLAFCGNGICHDSNDLVDDPDYDPDPTAKRRAPWLSAPVLAPGAGRML